MIHEGQGFTMVHYHKARGSTNYSFHIARFLPTSVTKLIVFYIVYIRPFVKLVFRQCFQSGCDPSPKRKGREQQAQNFIERLTRRTKNTDQQPNDDLSIIDKGYIFCDDKSPNECWSGTELSAILQEESERRLGTKIGIWTWRHVIIAITKAHLEEIAPFFERDEAACKSLLERNVYYSIFPWQAGHQPRVNVAVYGLDAAFPGQMQPALLHFYRHISQIWHHWLGLGTAAERSIWSTRAKRLLHEIAAEGDTYVEENGGDLDRDIGLKDIKRQKVTVDSGTQTTPKKSTSALEIKVEDSPTTKGLILNMKERLESVANIIELRRASKKMMTELS